MMIENSKEEERTKKLKSVVGFERGLLEHNAPFAPSQPLRVSSPVNLGGRQTQRLHLRFSPSGPGFESQLYCIVREQ